LKYGGKTSDEEFMEETTVTRKLQYKNSSDKYETTEDEKSVQITGKKSIQFLKRKESAMKESKSDKNTSKQE
jgi:hypothetical protein